MKQQKSVAVIGAGPMGLMTAWELLKRGFAVHLYEHDDRIGGMSAAFDFDGLLIERYYHFICKPDSALFELLAEFGLTPKLRWVDTRMGYFLNGKLYPWGTPQALLTCPALGLFSKLRYAMLVMRLKGISDWRKLDNINVVDWLCRWGGARGYEVLWKRLFELKFHGFTHSVSAAWLGTRVKRVGLSRRNLFQESLAYLEGGSEVLLRKLAAAIAGRGGQIHLQTPVKRVVTGANSQVSGVETAQGIIPHDLVISTIPIQYVPRLVPDLPASFRRQIDAIQNIAVACVILKLKHALTPNFWININDPAIAIPGIIEYSNLNPGDGSHIVYAPFYMPVSHPKYRQDDHLLIAEVVGYLKVLQPAFEPDWVLTERVSRYEYAQTVCPPGFFDMLPPMKTPVDGLWMADTAYYYPEDRSICESVKLGKQLARAVADANA